MRPERLVLKGFGAFRNRTEIDFSGVELFALTGPTGSGKTTILDGICFALYGSVPRHDKGSVAPIVTQGLVEATVALTFSIDDEVFSVARRVRKDPKGKGASTDEASLEQGPQVLASGAGQVTELVTELLGLDFDQFTTCVLLPQGEFARFLHDKPGGRQDLLTALLDLGIYDRVGQLALTRQRVAETRLAMLDQRLEALETVTEGDLAAARSRAAVLGDLLAWVEETMPELSALEQEVREVAGDVDHHQAMLAALGSLRLPDDLEVLGAATAKARTKLDEAHQALEATAAAVSSLAEKGASLPGKGELAHWAEARQGAASARQELGPATLAVTEKAEALTIALSAAVAARQAVAAAADSDRAAHLRRGLKVGDPCPVCGQPISDLAEPPPTGGVAKAEAELAACEREAEKARKAYAEAENTVHRLQARIDDLSRQLEGVASEEELALITAHVDEHEQAVEAGQRQLAAAREGLEAAEEQRKTLTEREAAIKSGFQAAWARLTQSGLEPPPFDLEDPFAAWWQLGEWRMATEPRLTESADKARALLEEVGQRRQMVTGAIVSRLDSLEVKVGAGSPRDDVVDALSAARSHLQKVAESLEEAAAKVAERVGVDIEQKTARQLSLELRADRFKKWLFDEVFSSLVAGANLRLVDLTRGQYELVMEGRDFEVIDNLSAGNRRSVKTLSGGETFLVSLALALALAERVAEMATAWSDAGGRLDSFFLDEGFGTLDAESLDLVAAVITDLGAAGKTVGIVTHVAELAEQMPVRYEVEKGTGGAMVSTVKL